MFRLQRWARAMLDSRMTRTASGASAEDMLSGAVSAPPPFTVPIFLASAVTGAAVPLLHAFLNALRPASSGGQGPGSPSPPASPMREPGTQQPNGAAATAAEQPAIADDPRTEPADGFVREPPLRAEKQPATEPTHFQVSPVSLRERTSMRRAQPHVMWSRQFLAPCTLLWLGLHTCDFTSEFTQYASEHRAMPS